MQLTSLLVTIFLASNVAAKGDGVMKVMSDAGMCKMLRKENQLIALANNQTMLESITKGNTTKQDEIKTKAQEAQTQLTMMQSNQTLMATCEVINAQVAEEDQCTQSFILQKFVAFAANETAVATVTQNNASKIADIQLKASQAAAKLDVLNSNTTLQADCPAVFQKDECKFMNGLMKFVSFANNQTMLDMVTKGNTTKETQIKKQAEQAQTQLTAMQSNATMVAACDALKAQSGKGTTQSSTSGTGTNSISSDKNSAASMEKFPGVGSAVLSAVVAIIVGVSLL
jgi:hypothetical protein